MKPLEDLTTEEVKEFVTVALENTTFLTSKIETLSPSSMTYAGTSYRINNSDYYQKLLTALEKYEMYKLYHTRHTLDSLVDDILKDTVDNHYIKRIEALIEVYSESVERFTKRISDDSDGLENLSKTLSDNFRRFNTTLDEVAELSEEVIPKDTKEAIKGMISGVNSLTHETRSEFEDVKKEFTDVVNNLKTLF